MCQSCAGTSRSKRIYPMVQVKGSEEMKYWSLISQRDLILNDAGEVWKNIEEQHMKWCSIACILIRIRNAQVVHNLKLNVILRQR